MASHVSAITRQPFVTRYVDRALHLSIKRNTEGPMGLTAMWTAGHAVTVETPKNLASITPRGGGIDLSIQPGRSSWFHIAIPTPVISNDVRAKLFRCFLLFESPVGRGLLNNVHIFDGPTRIQEFRDLRLSGAHGVALDEGNTFTLSTPHIVLFGISISFFFQAATGIDSAVPPILLRVTTAGADFAV